MGCDSRAGNRSSRMRRGCSSELVGDPAVRGVGILARPPPRPEAEAPVVRREGRPARDPWDIPAGQVGEVEARVPGWGPEVVDVAHGDPDPVRHELREGLGEPGTQGKDEEVGAQRSLTAVQGEVRQPSARRRPRRGPGDPDLSPSPLEEVCDPLAGRPGPGHPGSRLVEGLVEPLRPDLGPAPPDLVHVQNLVRHAREVPDLPDPGDEGISLAAEDQVPGLEEDPPTHGVGPLFVEGMPALDGPVGPRGPELPPRVRGADPPGLVPGGGAGIPRPVEVHQGHPGPRLLESEGGPETEDPGPHHYHIPVPTYRCHRGRGSSGRRGGGTPRRQAPRRPSQRQGSGSQAGALQEIPSVQGGLPFPHGTAATQVISTSAFTGSSRTAMAVRAGGSTGK
jgi:hypothetical protein